MSFFDGEDVNEIPDNPNELPNDTYKFQVISAELKPTNDGSKTGIVFKYQILEGPWKSFFPISDWVQVPDQNTRKDEKGRMLSNLKMRLLVWGFPIEEIQAFGKGSEKDCIGRTFYGTTFLKKDLKTQQSNIRISKFAPITENVDDDMFTNSPDI